jgi:hypothetical protein
MSNEEIIIDKDRVIKNQATVIKEVWSELQSLKRILIDDYPIEWREIQDKNKQDL